MKHRPLLISQKSSSVLYLPPGKDAETRQYNLPTGRSEVAALIPESILEGDNDARKVDREIRVHLRKGGLQYISNCSPFLDALRGGGCSYGLQLLMYCTPPFLK